VFGLDLATGAATQARGAKSFLTAKSCNPPPAAANRGEKLRVLFWYCKKFAWNPTIKTLDDAPHAVADTCEDVVVAFIHVEPKDIEDSSSAETKLVKNSKWLARKWGVKQIILHSFTHLGEEKADSEQAKSLLDRVQERLKRAEYETVQTPYGYFNDLSIEATGHPLARIFKEF
jgi:hypothetical protein